MGGCQKTTDMDCPHGVSASFAAAILHMKPKMMTIAPTMSRFKADG